MTINTQVNKSSIQNIYNFAGNPNGHVAGALYEYCLNTSSGTLYYCSTAGSSMTAVRTALVSGGSGGNLAGFANWVNGTGVTTSSANISSVTLSSTGILTVNFSPSFTSSTSYGCVAMGFSNTNVVVTQMQSQSASTCNVLTTVNGSPATAPSVYMAFTGN